VHSVSSVSRCMSPVSAVVVVLQGAQCQQCQPLYVGSLGSCRCAAGCTVSAVSAAVCRQPGGWWSVCVMLERLSRAQSTVSVKESDSTTY